MTTVNKTKTNNFIKNQTPKKNQKKNSNIGLPNSY